MGRKAVFLASTVAHSLAPPDVVWCPLRTAEYVWIQPRETPLSFTNSLGWFVAIPVLVTWRLPFATSQIDERALDGHGASLPNVVSEDLQARPFYETLSRDLRAENASEEIPNSFATKRRIVSSTYG